MGLKIFRKRQSQIREPPHDPVSGTRAACCFANCSTTNRKVNVDVYKEQFRRLGHIIAGRSV
ncbi:hypothetical protein KIN20_028111 [Parelaphostrongylus tenuis]|uniref:Uncharacterized protein n=1 Tax=Parelaphostrongylus tenuis TaxID=148309 RepID=A0AAD5R098_PARTN|nr:hypothetical protein KIN20_028111 [Parelaphostrongylus tenuis]